LAFKVTCEREIESLLVASNQRALQAESVPISVADAM